jgi:hypothetical protein
MQLRRCGLLVEENDGEFYKEIFEGCVIRMEVFWLEQYWGLKVQVLLSFLEIFRAGKLNRRRQRSRGRKILKGISSLDSHFKVCSFL